MVKALPANNSQLGALIDDRPAQFPAAVTLQGQYGRVVKFDVAQHGPVLWQNLQQDDAIWTYMRVGPFANEQEFNTSLRERGETEDKVNYAILDTKNVAVGMFWLMAIRTDMRVCEVGNVVYSKALQKTALGTEAQFLLMRYVFEDLGFRRFEWKTNTLNSASRRAALRYGFTFEGIFRQNEIVKGRNRDTAWYSMLDTEWPRVKKAFESWLSEGNFDTTGAQKRPLKI